MLPDQFPNSLPWGIIFLSFINPADSWEHFMGPIWLEWATRLQALAQNGLTFTTNPFDIERYRAVQRVAAEMLAAGSGTPIERVLDLFSLDVGYATPKIDVRGVVFRGDALLLVRERADNNRWTLPGGWADVGNSPGENAEREIYEESGYRARATKVLAIYDRRKQGHVPPNPHHIYKIFFLCELTGGEAAGSAETDGAAFFHQHEVPADLSLGRVTPAQIARMFEHHRHPEWPTDFD
jgi:ADP-ribose pyrophosphatase YjhB (NUDIX family)